MTIRDGVRGMVTASHCTNAQKRIGGLNNTAFRQPTPSQEVVANETIDPSTTSLSHEQCGGHSNCRYTDSTFAEKSSAADIHRGKIARPESLGSLRVHPIGTTWDIGREGYPSNGTTVYYVGKEKGWREATVTATCELVQTGGARVVCSALAEVSSSGDRPEGGDSGGPVFELVNGEAELVGILFAKPQGDSNTFAFSKTGMIYTDLGVYSTWDTCASGC